MTPILNFFKAHFVGGLLESLEIAQKPNRTLRIHFSKGPSQPTIVFKCFPHGQHLQLFSDGKFVQFPLRPKEDEAENVTFVEPEKQTGWAFNDEIADRVGSLGPRQKVAKPEQTYRGRLIRKIERSLAALDAGVEKSKEEDLVKITKLQKEAEQMQGGDQIQSIFTEIKRLKRKALQTATRRNELLGQLEKIRSMPDDTEEPAMPSKTSAQGGFSGTRVRLDERCELWVGRTDWQNDDLLRTAAPHELWIHLRDYPGAHGVIRCPKKTVPTPAQIEQSCRIVAILSQKKKSPFQAGEPLDFIVTPKKFVKKPKGAAPGRVIVERESVRRVAFKTIKFDPY